jgi:hypothetical protein
VPVKDSVVTVGADGTATQQYADLEAGIYRVRGTATVDGREVEATDIFLVKETGKELDQPQGDPETLQMLAQITNGTALGAITALPSDLRFDTPRVVRVDRRADVELWNRPGVLLLMVLLLGLEWFLRQRSGYV